MSKPRVAIAMSGGVDSSTAAALLVEQGYEVFGVMLRLWSAPDHRNRCCSPEDMALARRVAAHLDIPFYALDVQERFKQTVVDPFLDDYLAGITPNPCLNCNRSIRWGFMHDKSTAMGADFLATGHYARLDRTDRAVKLLRAVDRSKDQSYVLSLLPQEKLTRSLFPLGELTKAQVRAAAERFNLPVADRPDSQDLCFVGQADYRQFIMEQRGDDLPGQGNIVNQHGQTLGKHDGLPFYTIGQRKGLGLSASEPLYVLEKNPKSNRLVVGPRRALGRSRFRVNQVNWVSGMKPEGMIQAEIRVRYKAQEVNGLIVMQSDDEADIELTQPVPDVTPGQAAVFYDGEICLGGGIIRS
jgi:tRNA-specific 2-thiouridylase